MSLETLQSRYVSRCFLFRAFSARFHWTLTQGAPGLLHSEPLALTQTVFVQFRVTRVDR